MAKNPDMDLTCLDDEGGPTVETDVAAKEVNEGVEVEKVIDQNTGLIRRLRYLLTLKGVSLLTLLTQTM